MDLSEVVINQQKMIYPDQQWKVMDVLNMDDIDNESAPVIIDKSLIDTLLCGSNR